jgi:four helix bundle protein
MAFDTYDRARDLLRALAPLIARLDTHDTDLAKQLRKSAGKIPAQIAEANRRKGKDRTHLFRCALGEAAEIGGHLDAAVDLGYLDADDVAVAAELADRVRALTYVASR